MTATTSATTTGTGGDTQPDDLALPSALSAAATGLIAAAQAVVTGLLIVIVPAIVLWILTPKISVPWSEAARQAANVYVLAQGGSLALAHGQVDVVPLGLAVPLAWVAWLGGCRVRDAAAAYTGVAARRFLVVGAVVFVTLHALAATVLAAIAGNTQARAPLGAALTGSATMAVVGLAIALYPTWQPVQERWSIIIGAASRLLLGWLGLGALVVLVGLGFGFSRVLDVQNALHPGAVGHVLLIVLQLLLLPTAIVWGASYATGPGFALGAGTQIAPGHTELGPMPAIPLLGALPEPGRHTIAMILLPLLVLAVAGYVGYRLQADRGSQLVATRVVDACLTAALVAGVGYALAGLSSGAIGPGRMADVGPAPFQLAFVLFGELILGLLLGTFVGPLIASGRASDAAQRGARKAGRATATGLNTAAGRARDLGGNAAERAKELGESAVRNAKEIGAPAVGRAKESATDKARSIRRGRPGRGPGETRSNNRPRR